MNNGKFDLVISSMITRQIENVKSEIRNIKFLTKKEVQQITIAVVISGIFAAILFSLADVALNYVIQMVILS